MDRAQRVDEKNEIICLVILLLSLNITINPFFVFSSNDGKKWFTIWPKYISASERSFWVLSENGMVNSLYSHDLLDIEGRKIRKSADSVKSSHVLYFQGLKSC